MVGWGDKVGDKYGSNGVGEGGAIQDSFSKKNLYGRNMWVVTGCMIKLLEGFHHWSYRRILGMTDLHTTGGDLEWPPVVDALDTSDLWRIK